jgi:hypothetical protein
MGSWVPINHPEAGNWNKYPNKGVVLRPPRKGDPVVICGECRLPYTHQKVMYSGTWPVKKCPHCGRAK